MGTVLSGLYDISVVIGYDILNEFKLFSMCRLEWVITFFERPHLEIRCSSG